MVLDREAVAEVRAAAAGRAEALDKAEARDRAVAADRVEEPAHASARNAAGRYPTAGGFPAWTRSVRNAT